ncbi:S41 family peptidase [uncultured Lacinutrix sp.]|uniref:S41 family peptidase n=1 Tax=uncultured Lacinutrix sp. TaxID=574032 RepID=UPI002613A3A7|nr:S41 family peptidase [uncultured Lacinutrix sp.]
MKKIKHFIFLSIIFIGCSSRIEPYTSTSKEAMKLYKLHLTNSKLSEVQEDSINALAYHKLENEDIENSLEIFRLNTFLYPDSYNVYDSYAEILLRKGDSSKAIANYKKSLELNSTNDNAFVKLQEIEEAKQFGSLSIQEYTFESFWNFYEKNYSHFNIKNVDWKREYSKYRNKISSSTPDSTLFGIMENMLRDFNDVHVTLEAGEEYYYESKKESKIVSELIKARTVLYPNNEGSITKRYFNAVDSTLYINNFSSIKTAGSLNETLPWISYSRNKHLGYLRTISFMPEQPMQEQMQILDSIFKEFTGVDGLIIDLRLNSGGYDLVAMRFMGKLINRKILSHRKQNRRGNYKEFDSLQDIYIEPIGNYKFTKKIIILINDKTVSAGEMIPLGLSQLDHVKIVGSPSNGSLSDALYKMLPNGWISSLSNERYFDVINGKDYEGKGIPVQFEINNTADDIINFNDSVLKKAIEILNEWK